MSDRRARGLCYWCDEKFTPEHYMQHKKNQTQLYSLDAGESGLHEEVESSEDEEQLVEITPQVSINAVSGFSDYTTMRVKGTFGKRTLFILLDSGSTHNFMDPEIATKLGCEVQASKLSKVTVADGRKLGIQGRVDNFEWNLKNTTFSLSVMLIPLQGCDVVLGVQWLATLGPITWEFNKLEMGFMWENKKVLLHGIREGSVRDMKAKKLNKLQDDRIQISMICVNDVENGEYKEMCSLSTINTGIATNAAVEKLIAEFPMVFSEPKELPPFWKNHDHDQIQVMKGATPVNQRPYRYAIHQKNEIDKIVEEMLLVELFSLALVLMLPKWCWLRRMMVVGDCVSITEN